MVSSATPNHVWYQPLEIQRLTRFYGELVARTTGRNNPRTGFPRLLLLAPPHRCGAYVKDDDRNRAQKIVVV